MFWFCSTKKTADKMTAAAAIDANTTTLCRDTCLLFRFCEIIKSLESLRAFSS